MADRLPVKLANGSALGVYRFSWTSADGARMEVQWGAGMGNPLMFRRDAAREIVRPERFGWKTPKKAADFKRFAQAVADEFEAGYDDGELEELQARRGSRESFKDTLTDSREDSAAATGAPQPKSAAVTHAPDARPALTQDDRDRRQQAFLDRAVSSGNPEQVLGAAREAVREWSQPGVLWPDNWRLWQQALDDAFPPGRRVSMHDLAGAPRPVFDREAASWDMRAAWDLGHMPAEGIPAAVDGLPAGEVAEVRDILGFQSPGHGIDFGPHAGLAYQACTRRLDGQNGLPGAPAPAAPAVPPITYEETAGKTTWTARTQGQLVAALARKGWSRESARDACHRAYRDGSATAMNNAGDLAAFVTYGNSEVDLWDAEIKPSGDPEGIRATIAITCLYSNDVADRSGWLTFSGASLGDALDALRAHYGAVEFTNPVVLLDGDGEVEREVKVFGVQPGSGNPAALGGGEYVTAAPSPAGGFPYPPRPAVPETGGAKAMKPAGLRPGQQVPPRARGRGQ